MTAQRQDTSAAADAFLSGTSKAKPAAKPAAVTSKDRVKVTAYLDPLAMAKLERIAARDDRSVAYLLRQAVDAWLAEQN
jgi:hypothetical protein